MSEPARLFRTPTLSRSLVLERTWPFFLDLSVAACGLGLFYAVLRIAQYWMGHPVAAVAISRSPKMLPLYAFYSVVRIGVAYLLSLIFAVGYGYIAAYNPRAEGFMIAVLDILQSIPVLSFLPGVMLAMVSLIPGAAAGDRAGGDPADFHRAGLEYGLQLLFLAQESTERAPGSEQGLSLLCMAALLAAGIALLGHWAGLELDGVGRGRMVFSDGLRDVCPG